MIPLQVDHGAVDRVNDVWLQEETVVCNQIGIHQAVLFGRLHAGWLIRLLVRRLIGLRLLGFAFDADGRLAERRADVEERQMKRVRVGD